MTKQKLLDTIKGITDQSIIDDIQRLLQLELDEELFLTSSKQKGRIAHARSDIRSGKIIDSKLADNEIDEWLNE